MFADFTEDQLRELETITLKAQLSDVEVQLDKLRRYYGRLRDELNSRTLKARVGDTFVYDGQEYMIVEVGNMWPQAARKTKAGNWAITRRYCYGWLAWREGKHNDPFNSKPMTIGKRETQ